MKKLVVTVGLIYAIPMTLTANVSASTISSNIVPTAKSLVGVPYRWGGTTTRGFDCSGYVQYVYKKQGLKLPRTSQEMYNNSTRVSSPKPGDLVFFNTNGPGPTHVGLFVGNGQFASATSRGVTVTRLSNSYWGSHYLGIRRPHPQPLYV